MPPTEPQPVPDSNPPKKPEPVIEPHHAHTYQDDLSKAMNATDAKVVQEMLETAREKEELMLEKSKRESQRRLYSILSFFFVVVALVAIGYGYYYYRTLTVPVTRTYSVGVFPSTEPIVADDTDIRKVTEMQKTTTLPEDKPTLAMIVAEANNLVPLTTNQFFQFIEAQPSEPFAGAIDAIRLGAMNTGVENVPFIILSVPDREVASKEFLIAEPDLLEIFYKALGIDISEHEEEIGRSFSGEYLYNLPVRSITSKNAATGEETLTLLYGYVTDHIVVITTQPEVLKQVYDTIIRQ